MKVRIAEALDIDLEQELWCCNRCGHELGSARDNYKKFVLVCQRDPREIHNPYIEPKEPRGYALAPDPEWCRLVEFYCPNCAVMFDVEYLPPGHPVTHDLEIDIDALKTKYGGGAKTARRKR
jgi:acetone carboxylase gamma subunit